VEALRVLAGGILGMVVVMGIGRFVYTPILPLMQRDLGLSHTAAGWLAGWNYLGYLAGALVCSIWPHALQRRAVNAAALAASIAATWAMGATASMAGWSLLRLVGGITSAMVFIVITAEVAQTLNHRGCAKWSGTLYSGIGLGIAISGLLVPQLDRWTDWRGCWQAMGILAAALAGLGLILGRGRESMPPAVVEGRVALNRLRPLSLLSCAYFLEGLGYVVTATFVVAILAATPGLESIAPYSWVVVGLAAVPATALWPYAASRHGARRAILAAYGIQAAGIAISVHARGTVLILVSAAAFGGTFLGIVALVLSEGRRRLIHDGRWATAVLTASFGLGQMLGPIAAGILADLRHGFALPLGLAAGAVALGAGLVAIDPGFQPSD
jgi:predicted MFS family arabinose efflux permease